MILGILGEKLTGKDTVAEYLAQKYGAVHVRTSQILDDLLNALGLPLTRRNEIEAGRGMEMAFGERVIGEAVLRRVRKAESKIVVINGLRQDYQFQDAKRLGAKIIYITAALEVRYERRGEMKDGQQTLEQFLEQDKEWIEKEVPVLGAKADFKIENSGSLEELYKKVEEVLGKLKY